uniref:Uncharacterized protein n=1 Tax=Rhizophora mucronata TaxID=61149 RepID=A0A2P2IWU7_RHIMU
MEPEGTRAILSYYSYYKPVSCGEKLSTWHHVTLWSPKVKLGT